MDSAWMPLLVAAVSGGAVGSLATAIIQLFGWRWEHKRELSRLELLERQRAARVQRKVRQRLQDERAARLRLACSDVVAATYSFGEAFWEIRNFDGDDMSRADALLDKAATALDRAKVPLALDYDGPDLMTAIQRARTQLELYRLEIEAIVQSGSPTAKPSDAVSPSSAQVLNDIRDVETKARTLLAEASKPVQ
jgi:hypothetical protein